MVKSTEIAAFNQLKADNLKTWVALIERTQRINLLGVLAYSCSSLE